MEGYSNSDSVLITDFQIWQVCTRHVNNFVNSQSVRFAEAFELITTNPLHIDPGLQIVFFIIYTIH